jgi:hypothetical protein
MLEALFVRQRVDPSQKPRRTTPISFNNTSRCWSKKDLSAGCCAVVDDEAGGRVVLDAIFVVFCGVGCLQETRG